MKVLCLVFVLLAGRILPTQAATQALEIPLTGSITVDGDGPFPSPTISFRQSGTTIREVRIERNGKFATTLPTGDYSIAVSPLPANYVLKALSHGSVDLLNNPLRLTGPLPQEIQLAIGVIGPPKWVRVSGLVAGADKLPTFLSDYVVLSAADILPLRAPIRMDGAFEFPRVLPANYTISVTDASESSLREIAPRALQVVAGSNVNGVELTAVALVPVIGRIQLEGQAPLPYLSLFFRGPSGLISSDIGNAAGSVTARLPPGEYRVTVGTMSRGYAVTNILRESVDLLTQPLNVESGKQLDLTIKIRTELTGVKVSGRVIRTSDSSPAPGTITLSLPLPLTISTDYLPGPRSVSAPVKPNGSFEFTNVIPGSYMASVDVDPSFRSDHLTILQHEPEPVLVGSTDVMGIEVRLPNQVRLTGRLTVEDGSPMPRPSIHTQFVRSSRGLLGFGVAGPLPDVDGRFEIVLPEGSYQFSVRELPAGYYVKSMLQAGREILNQPFALSPDSHDFVFVIGATAPARKISGRVIDAPNPASTSSINVALWTGIMSIRATVGPNGRFEFPRVPPATYSIGVEGTSLGSSPALVAIGGNPAPGTSTVTVADKDIEDLRVVSNTPIQSFLGKGRVIIDGGGPMPRFSLTMNGGGGSVDPSPVDGVFQAWFSVGFSKVRIEGIPQEYVLKSLTYGDTDLLQGEMNVRADDTKELRVVLTPSQSSRWKKVTGRLMGIESLGAGQVHVHLSSLKQNMDVVALRDGAFEFPQMVSGTYNVAIRIENQGSVHTIGLPQLVVIAENDIAGLEIPAPRPITVNIATSEIAPPAETLHLWLSRQNGNNRSLDFQRVDGTATRYFTSGDRLELSRIPFGYRVKDVRYGAIDLLKEPLRFENSDDVPISVTLEAMPPDPQRAEFTLTGRVQSSTNAARRRVTATYVEPGAKGSIEYTMVETFVRDDGSFQFDRLPPGPYEIRIAGRPEVSRAIVPDERGTGVTLTIP